MSDCGVGYAEELADVLLPDAIMVVEEPEIDA